MKPIFKIKRVYEDPSKEDGERILIDRIWPRGITKQDASIDHWIKELAPSTTLRVWFSHDPLLWNNFQKKYRSELSKNKCVNEFIKQFKDAKVLTLVYAAKDEKHTHALVLQEYLEKQLNEN